MSKFTLKISKMKVIPLLRMLIVLVLLTSGVSIQAQTQLTTSEKKLVEAKATSEAFRVLLTTQKSDSLVLRSKATEVAVHDPALQYLAQRMLTTVVQEKGVGIAGPQIGLARKVFWVKRYDKPGMPFEFFINPTITWYSDVLRLGREGCLSIPDKYGQVYRSLIIRISYYNLEGKFHDEVIEGFTAVICQHEFDHLIGVLYTDHLLEQEKSKFTKADNHYELYYKE
jgi:peptide deformylase